MPLNKNFIHKSRNSLATKKTRTTERNGFTQHFIFPVFEAPPVFPIMFYKLRAYSDNFLFKYLLVTS